MNRPLLSICIPTYNRSKYLKECLDSIVSQMSNQDIYEQIEIVITDNASTDDTTKTVQEFQKKYSNIHYFRNEKNLGFDRSFTKLIEKSRGKYCLSIGDDDAFFEGSIAMLLQKIQDTDVPYFGLNCWGYDHALQHPVLPMPTIHLKKDLHFKKLSDYVKTIPRYTDLVGVFVGLSTQLFLRDPWVLFEPKDPYFDTLAVHMYVLMSIYKSEPYTIIAEPVIKTRSSNIRWDVFAGLETIQGRITSTIKIATWVKDTFNLPISNTRMILYFYTREYWFTFKEIAKAWLTKVGLKKIIVIYRKMR